jgi:transcriptional regulator with XRE-family HTH domain
MNLKALIFSKGLTQWELCRRIGWHESKLSRIVTGRQSLSPDELQVLAKVLKVSVKELQDAIE